MAGQKARASQPRQAGSGAGRRRQVRWMESGRGHWAGRCQVPTSLALAQRLLVWIDKTSTGRIGGRNLTRETARRERATGWMWTGGCGNRTGRQERMMELEMSSDSLFSLSIVSFPLSPSLRVHVDQEDCYKQRQPNITQVSSRLSTRLYKKLH